MIPVVRLAPGNQWDQNLLDLLFANQLYPTGLEFERFDAYAKTPGIALIVPGRYWAGHELEIGAALTRYDWVLAIRTSDEEDLFDITKVEHSNIRWWVQTPRRDYDARVIPLGFPPHFNHLEPAARNLDVFLSAQNTHDRRRQAFAAIPAGPRTHVEATPGFTQGMSPVEYVQCMTGTKVAPAPSGAVSPDSFRVYEALEAHAVPIADDISPAYDSAGYWESMFPGAPFPILRNYTDLPGYIEDVLADYPRIANRTAAWWIAQKRRMAEWLGEDLSALGAPADPSSGITVVVSTSPIKSHPSTTIIDETIATVRAQLPAAEIILTCDGVRPEQGHRRADYETYLQRVLWKADHEWGNTLPLIFDEHLHQGECTRRALEHIRTPLMLFVEADTPLIGEIPWDEISDTILSGDANVVRFSHEANILEPHRYLMLDETPQKVRGVPMTRTVQWSQRPHLASVAWYRELLDHHLPAGVKDFIEDRCYGPLVNSYNRDGVMAWMNWRTWIYTPEGDIKRSYHTDGREGEPKFD